MSGFVPPVDPPAGAPPVDTAAPAVPAPAATESDQASPYAGLVTRVLAFATDALVINVVGWFVAIVVALGLSLLDIPDGARDVLLAIGSLIGLLWSAGYFVLFWSTTGQTLGNRLLRIRVQDALTGSPPSPRRALWRLLVLPLSAIPLCAGFLLILVDPRRRALHDLLARTVVADVVDEPERVRSDVRPQRRA